jgi:hypothetical protein
VCRDSQHYDSSYSSASQGTKAAFGYAGYSLGYGNSASDTSAHSSQAIDRVCKMGKSHFLNVWSGVSKDVRAQSVTNLIGDCINKLVDAKLEALTGFTKVSRESEGSFVGKISYRAGASDPSRVYTLTGIAAPDSSQVKCSMAGAKDQRIVLNPGSDAGFVCSRKPGADVNGYFNFTPNTGPNKSIRFNVPSLSGHDLVVAQVKEQLVSEFDKKIKDIQTKLQEATLSGTTYLKPGNEVLCTLQWGDPGSISTADCEGYILLSGGCSMTCLDMQHVSSTPVQMPGHVQPNAWECHQAPDTGSKYFALDRDNKPPRSFHARLFVCEPQIKNDAAIWSY